MAGMDRLDRVEVNVAGEIVDITWDERDQLLGKLRVLEGSETIVLNFEAVGASRPVELTEEQRSQLRVILELWGVNVLPEGLADLLMALVRADPAGPSALDH
jgi:hypothetical protein